MKYKIIISSSLISCLVFPLINIYNDVKAEEYKVTYIYADWEKTNKPVVDYIESEEWKQHQKELKEKEKEKQQISKNKKTTHFNKNNQEDDKSNTNQKTHSRYQEKNNYADNDRQKLINNSDSKSKPTSNYRPHSLPETGEKIKDFSAQDKIGYLLLGIECLLIGSFLIYKSFTREV